MKTRKILVPTDFSDGSQRAVDLAARWAAAWKAELLLLSIVEPLTLVAPEAAFVPFSNPGAIDDDREAFVAKKLEEMAAKARAGKIRAKTRVVRGAPDVEIVEEAARAGADVIVISTHGRGGFSRLVLGSVSEDVIRMSPIPVVSVRAPGDGDEKPKSRVPRGVRSILLAVDPAAPSDSATDAAITFARAFEARVLVLAAVVPLSHVLIGAEPWFEGHLVQLSDSLLHSAEERAGEVARKIERRNVPADVLVVEGRADRVIVDTARRRRSDLILLGTHSQSPIIAGLLGGVTEKVLRVTPAPVMTVRD